MRSQITKQALEAQREHFKEFCIKMISFVQEHDPDGIFSYPITDEIAPGYSSLIKNPMDTTTLLEKVKRGEYVTKVPVNNNPQGDFERDVSRFCRDFFRIFSNAMEYNEARSDIYRVSKALHTRSRQYWVKESGGLYSLNNRAARLTSAQAPATPATPQAKEPQPRKKRRYTRSGAYRRDPVTGEFLHSAAERAMIIQSNLNVTDAVVSIRSREGRLETLFDCKQSEVPWVGSLPHAVKRLFPSASRPHPKASVTDVDEDASELPPEHPLAAGAFPDHPYTSTTRILGLAQANVMQNARVFRRFLRADLEQTRTRLTRLECEAAARRRRQALRIAARPLSAAKR